MHPRPTCHQYFQSASFLTCPVWPCGTWEAKHPHLPVRASRKGQPSHPLAPQTFQAADRCLLSGSLTSSRSFSIPSNLQVFLWLFPSMSNQHASSNKYLVLSHTRNFEQFYVVVFFFISREPSTIVSGDFNVSTLNIYHLFRDNDSMGEECSPHFFLGSGELWLCKGSLLGSLGGYLCLVTYPTLGHTCTGLHSTTSVELHREAQSKQ